MKTSWLVWGPRRKWWAIWSVPLSQTPYLWHRASFLIHSFLSWRPDELALQLCSLEQMLPCQVSLILLQKPQEAGCREITSAVGTGGLQPTLCAHKGGMALSLILGAGEVTNVYTGGMEAGCCLLPNSFFSALSLTIIAMFISSFI